MLKRVVLVLVVGVFIGSSLAGAQAAAPKMTVPSKIVDLGVVAQGIKADAVFRLANEGSADLLVRSVRPTCGCTVADYDKEIAPGATGEIKAKLDTAGFSGPITKSILVMTNDPDTPSLTLVIKGDVQPFVELLPRPLVRFNATQFAGATESVKVVSETTEVFKITKVESSVPYITASMRKLDESERVRGKGATQYEVTLTLTEEAPVGPVNADLPRSILPRRRALRPRNNYRGWATIPAATIYRRGPEPAQP